MEGLREMARFRDWNKIFQFERVEREEKIKTAGCSCGSGTCLRARNRKCVCSCGGANHAILFKQKNQISSLDEFEEEEGEENPPYIS